MIGRYLVISRLGVGGMGIVFAAYDPELDRKVAIKLIKSAGGRGTDVARTRLLREAQALAKVEHPNVVAVYDVGTHEGSVFIAMEYIHGQTLRQWLADEPREVGRIVEVFEAAARGVAAAHATGLVHRDLKPDNIMLGKDGRVRVMDFGLARAHDAFHQGAPTVDATTVLEDDGRTEDDLAGAAMERIRGRLAEVGKLDASAGPSGGADTLAAEPDDAQPRVEGKDAFAAALTKTGAMLGTPAYMAPEQVAGKMVDARTDVFALSVCLFEAVYRRRPFVADTLPELLTKILQASPRTPPAGSTAPQHLRRAIERGMARRPADRPPGMEAFAASLRAPPARGRFIWAALGVLALGGGAAWAWLPGDVCTQGRAEIEGVWNGNARRDVREKWAELDLPYGAQTLERAEAEVERYADAWTAGWTDACEASRVRKVQSDALLERRMACLEERRAALRQHVVSLKTADADSAERALVAGAGLPGLELCGDATALLRDAVVPYDARSAAAVDGVRVELAAVAVDRRFGRFESAAEKIGGLERAATDLEFEPLLAEVQLEYGRLEERRGRFDEARGRLEDAAHRGRRSGADDTAAEAEVELVFVVGFRGALPEQGLWWAKHAEAAVERHREPEIWRARLQNLEGVVQFAAGDLAEGLARIEAAVQASETVLGAEHPDTLEAMNNLGVGLRRGGDLVRAEQVHRQVLRRRRARFGPAHPEVAKSLQALAAVLIKREDPGAKGLLDEAVDILEAGLGPDHPSLAGALNDRGSCLFATGDSNAARADFREALRIYRKSFPSEHPQIVRTQRNLERLARDENVRRNGL